IINVVFPSFRKPPVVANLVVWKLLSFNALTSVVESLSCTTAIISFIFHTSLFVIIASHTPRHLLSLGRSMLLHLYACFVVNYVLVHAVIMCILYREKKVLLSRADFFRALYYLQSAPDLFQDQYQKTTLHQAYKIQ